MQKMPMRLWPVIGSRAPSGKYCITTKMTHKEHMVLGNEIAAVGIGYLGRQLGLPE
jgi:uncharacterized membrane protein YjjB (DUF3815 family)